MRFSDIIYHDNIKSHLVDLADGNRIPHALLLHGKPGIGKLMMGRAFISYIHCQNRQNGDSCGECPACRQQQTFNHIDTFFSYPVNKSKVKSSRGAISEDYGDEWKKFLSENPFAETEKWNELLGGAQTQYYVDESQSLIKKLNFASHASRYKTVLMWLPEKMNEETANKLLKIIEEPYEDTIFILVSNEPEKILPTIYSRLQRLEMKRIPDQIIAKELCNRYNIDEDAAKTAARLSEGSFANALASLSSNEVDRQFLDMFISLMRLAYQRKIIDLRKWSAEAATLGRESLISFMSYCETFIGQNFIYNLADQNFVYMTSEELNFSRNFARFITEKNIEKLRKLFIDARNDISANGNAKIILFDIAIKVILLLKQ